MQHLTTCPDQFVDRFDHMNRNTDGARLIRDRTGDRLTDPPCRVGREFVTAAIFELINRLHQADVTFLNKVKELQATVGVFLGDRDNQTQVRFDHFLLGLTGFFFALLNLLHDAAEFTDVQTDVLTNLRHVRTQFFNLVRGALDEHLPATTGFLGHTLHPVGIKLVVAVFFDKLTAVDAGLIGQLHHRAVNRHDALVDAIELVNQRLDPVVVQVKTVHQNHNFGPQVLIAPFVCRAERPVFVQGRGNPAVLHFSKVFVIRSNPVQRFQNTWLQRGFHCRQRHVGLIIFVVIVVVIADRVAVGVQLGAGVFGFARGSRRSTGGRHDGFIHLAFFAHLARERGFKVDHITQQNVFGQKFLAPDGDRLECQRAFTKTCDHCVAARFDPLRNRDFAFTAQQFDRSHFAQIHTNRVIGAIQLFGRAGRQRNVTAFRGINKLGRAFVFLFFGFFVVFSNLNAHFGQHRHNVFDLVRRHLIRRQDFVQLIVSDVATFPGFCDHLLDRGLAHIERRVVIPIFCLGVIVIFGCHLMLLSGTVPLGGRFA